MSTSPERSDQGRPELEQTLFELIMGFRITQLIYVAAQLGLADLLQDGPQAVETLAQATSTHAPSLYRLLRALASHGVFAEDEQGCFALTPLAALLQSGVPGSQRDRALHYGEASEWLTWGDLAYSVATGETAFQHRYGQNPWAYRAAHPELEATFNGMMATTTLRQAASVVAAYDFSAIGTLVDVGGGQGVLLAAILQANPQLQGIWCDRPQLELGARTLLEVAGVLTRCAIMPCDFFVAVPEGGDAYLLKHILHDWDDHQALAVLRNCRQVMTEQARLLVVETIIPPGNSNHYGKMLDLQMLIELGGRERSQAEFSTLLGEAGFRLTRVVATDVQLSVIEAVPE